MWLGQMVCHSEHSWQTRIGRLSQWNILVFSSYLFSVHMARLLPGWLWHPFHTFTSCKVLVISFHLLEPLELILLGMQGQDLKYMKLSTVPLGRFCFLKYLSFKSLYHENMCEDQTKENIADIYNAR